MKSTSKLVFALALVLALTVFISSTGFTQEMSEKEYNKYLVKMLKDENIGIRSSAAQLLGERKVEEAVKPLTKMLTMEKHYAVRIMAALALYQIGTDDVLPILKKQVKKDRNRTVRHVLAGLIESMETTQYAKK
ncbi:MAG: HEAT repeat domain-containing protein [bacterium]|nr:MAG: HEAT repeat domain-containing protein [bacterium]